jgi:hypothetical protein
VREREVVKVPEWGKRDAGKVFLITEWPAERAEEWAFRALIGYNRGGGQVPVEAISGGMEAVFWLGVNTFLRGQMQAAEVIPILNELMECIKIIRDPNTKGPDGPVAHDVLPGDIEEIKTRLWLRSEVLRVHTNFSVSDLLSRLISEVMKRAAEASSIVPTSPKP